MGSRRLCFSFDLWAPWSADRCPTRPRRAPANDHAFRSISDRCRALAGVVPWVVHAQAKSTLPRVKRHCNLVIDSSNLGIVGSSALDLRRLRYFASIVHLGGFRAAAEAENISQPALTRQMQLLERELGVCLLDRTTRPIAPTAAGRILLKRSEALLAEASFIERSLRHLKVSDDRTITVGVLQTLLDDLFPRALLQWRVEYSDLDVRVRGFSCEAIRSLVVAGHVDVGIVTLPVADRRLEAIGMADEGLALIAAPGDEDGAAGISFEEALRQPILVFPEGFPTRSLLEAAAHDRGLQLTIQGELESIEAIKALVRAGFGRSILPLSGVMRDFRDGNLGLAVISDSAALIRRIGCVYRRGEQLSPSVQALILEVASLLRALPRPGGSKSVSLAPR
ncbi:MAG: LysR family transcriptional regulator [Spirochaetaceae bacterium]|nr:MAG: LysR family transcriptional regulator [Spirochaetaceae bacterium]